MKQSGFTLIELLTVIAIIGMLSSIIIFSVNAGRAKARDTKRLGDIRQIANALEIYYNECNSYPPRVPLKLLPAHTLAIGTPGTCAGGGIGSLTGDIIVGSFPKAPTPADGNVCGQSRFLDPPTNLMPAYNNEYVYESIDASGSVNANPPLPSYNLYFCLGSTTNGVSGNVLHRRTPIGIY